jgi:hypothetical protein
MEFKEWWINQGREWPNGNVNIHHIKPLSKGGTNSFENLVPLFNKRNVNHLLIGGDIIRKGGLK